MRQWSLFSLMLGIGCSEDVAGPATAVDAGAIYAAPDLAWVDPYYAGPRDDGGFPLLDPILCSGRTGPKGDHLVTLTSSGLPRFAELHVPSSYDPAQGAMLVVNLHGYGSNGPEQIVFTKMNGHADARHFLVAYPEGVGAPGPQSWNAGDCCGVAWTNSVDDIAFIRKLVERLENDYCIDPRRIYATGFSNGGFLSHRIACDLSDLFAAVAPVSGVLGIDPAQCSPKRPVPIMHFHGTLDPLEPYQGGAPFSPGLPGPLKFRSVAATLAVWRQRNGCSDQSTPFYQQGDTTCLRWAACTPGGVVQLCTIDGGGHTWPGGIPLPGLGKTSTDIDATSQMIDFFSAHPLL